jgi:uncharacterized Zn finger protein
MTPRKRVPPARKAVPPVERPRTPSTSRRRSPARRGFYPDVDGWWPPKPVPIRVEGGLQTKSQRGRIGESWWSGRFLAVLETFGLGSRLQRGKSYARRGQVIQMQVEPGRVSASVQGSRTKPYRVFIETATISEREWRSVENVMATRASFVARLLAGEMPDDIEEAFAASSCSLFPDSSDDVDAACSCPDGENPCKHIAAVYYLLAEAFDTDPFLILAWRGRNKDTLLSALRARRRGEDDALSAIPGHGAGPKNGRATRAGDAVQDGEEPGGALLGWPVRRPVQDEGARHAPDHDDGALGAASGSGFWCSAVDLRDLEVRPRLAVVPDLVLRQLDPAALGSEGRRMLERLRPMYEAMVTSAMRVLDDGADEQGQRSHSAR